ncbi:MAG: hypothetical protein SFZ23_08665 [Planctomycetota bacterium]|nr:hypothetical protein [Planctomycetota bacterium]
MATSHEFSPSWHVRPFWYTGFTYNATPGSRAAITTTITNGMALCLDPEAFDDRASLPSGMTLRGLGLTSTGALGSSQNARSVNVTRPATAILGLFAGIVVGQPPGGRAGPQTLQLATAGENIEALVQGNVAAYASTLVPVDGQFYLAPLTVSAGADILNVVGTSLFTENVASAALRRIRVGGFNRHPVCP